MASESVVFNSVVHVRLSVEVRGSQSDWKTDNVVNDKCNLYQSDPRIHLWKIFQEDRSTRHVILNERNARPLRGGKRVRRSCGCGAASPRQLLHHI
ncbi:hypothetical protein Y032_0119g798 [Ancylostoma ceylanicum]|uniref:Uncharacterized protein n=1 Tax=Ancylostoma ceylanicum TaxID=53326 RepID=A0A016TB31_9BILA|nr:hypothetical protein Y032_0119g798 [Ancylostoma ceylanicum]